MRGRSGCPTGQEKKYVGATVGSALFLLLQGKVGYRIAPSSDPASPAHLPPKGKAKFYCKVQMPSPVPARRVPSSVACRPEGGTQLRAQRSGWQLERRSDGVNEG